jgi:ammonium transporter Rh
VLCFASSLTTEGLTTCAMQRDSGRQFVTLFGLLQAILVILFVLFVEYDETVDGSTTDPDEPVQSIYPSFQDVHVMIFIGFGFLMTFLRKYVYGAVGFTFMIAAFCIQWAILNNEFWNKVVHNEVHEKIFIDIAK